MKTLSGAVSIAAHRGAVGCNIPYNTPEAFECALRQKADIIELDVSKSRDGALFVFHPKMEPAFLGIPTLLSEMDAAEIEKLRYLNFDRVPTDYPVARLEDVLLRLRGRCRVNVDKFWVAPREIASLIRRLGMEDQVIVKSRLSPQGLRDAEEFAADLPYMPVFYNEGDESALDAYRGRLVGAEVCFASENDPVGRADFTERMHEKGRIVWVNAIVYNYKKVLSAGHTDDLAVSRDPEAGWGWLADRGFDVIQTDFPLMLHEFLKERGLR